MTKCEDMCIIIQLKNQRINSASSMNDMPTNIWLDTAKTLEIIDGLPMNWMEGVWHLSEQGLLLM